MHRCSQYATKDPGRNYVGVRLADAEDGKPSNGSWVMSRSGPRREVPHGRAGRSESQKLASEQRKMTFSHYSFQREEVLIGTPSSGSAPHSRGS